MTDRQRPAFRGPGSPFPPRVGSFLRRRSPLPARPAPEPVHREPITGRAVVIGAGIAGLTAARVLADHFAEVVLLEAALLPSSPGPRGGVPQARHVHGMLARGAQTLEALFPGLRAELVAAGAPLFDHGLGASTTVSAGRVPRTRAGVHAHAFSRDLLEWSLRRRLGELPAVTVRDRAPVSGLCWSEDATRVTGVRLAGGDSLHAAFVVDASGRFSKLPRWLEEAGHPRPAVQVVDAGLAYATMVLDAPEQDFDALQHMNSAPGHPRGAFVVRVEGGRWLATVFGAGGDHPPTDEQGWRRFAAGLHNPELDALLAAATPVPDTGIHGFQRTENRRTGYAAMRRGPRRLVAIGDAVAAFDPVFGQGMTVSVLQAAALGECLADRDDLDAVGNRCRRRVASIARTPWLMSVSEDLAWHHHRERGRLPLWLRPVLWYKRRLIELVVADPEMFRTFLGVYHMVRSPAALVGPRTLARVVLGGRRTRPAERVVGAERAESPG
ncbi:FAD-dependent oxidoreductase [Actinacidiphila acidipaludis]|uniref:FAD-dependent monooxygenase n=1 Tax=Actinacidiphila acidipaludis TaxID=2873382 RepID=A0ABS7QIN8_9ACTN|nr:FAD-dependent monooxygenase [Streptomyces acidipaludis]MBY8883032.1 FAD-dependent monooxygenase [Streptomyces acidipaludis]